jgi:zona occludens toxin (predicted ATPase)
MRRFARKRERAERDATAETTTAPARPRACIWANAIVSGGTDPGRAGRALRRHSDRELWDQLVAKAIAPSGRR